MGRKLKAAAVQMDVTFAPVSERLDRATDLIAKAANAGAQLVVLPELFNTGYEYHERNYALAETIEGQTVTWMKVQVAQHDIHLVGTLMLLDKTDIYNAALLLAPDGRSWRHDKINVCLWERAYCRAGHHITIADTDLGKLGLMICADTLWPDLWAQYAGQVDVMVIMFSPGDLDNADLIFPDGFRAKYTELEETAVPADKDAAPASNNEFIEEQLYWLHVPAVFAGETGVVRTRLPRLELLLQESKLSDCASQASEVWLEMSLPMATGIGDAKKGLLTQGTTTGDGVVWAEIELADAPPQPQGPQPKMQVDEDKIARLVRPLYREGVRRQWGAHMARGARGVSLRLLSTHAPMK